MKIEDLTKNFKQVAEWKAFCEGQKTVIDDLQGKNQELLKKIKELEDLLESQNIQTSNLIDPYKGMSNELAVCAMQIKILKGKSKEGELTYDEAKKLDIYTKLLITITSKSEKENEALKGLDDKALIALVDG